MTHVILTAIGPDRPGLVDEVSEYIFQRGGNIEDSRMVNLRGQFAIMVLLSGETVCINAITADLDQLRQQSNLQGQVRPATPAASGPLASARPYNLTTTTLDQPGLVHRLSHLLRSLNINIESLDTQLRPAPITGAPLFEMQMLLSVPATVVIAKLRQELEQLCDPLNIDWQLMPLG